MSLRCRPAQRQSPSRRIKLLGPSFEGRDHRPELTRRQLAAKTAALEASQSADGADTAPPAPPRPKVPPKAIKKDVRSLMKGVVVKKKPKAAPVPATATTGASAGTKRAAEYEDEASRKAKK